MPRLYVIPAWLHWIELVAFLLILAGALDSAVTERTTRRALVSCEARAQASLVSAEVCSGHLTTCLGAVSRIADELQLSEAVLR